MLIDAGAPVTRQAGVNAMIAAAAAGCTICLDVIAEEAEPVALGLALDAAADVGSVGASSNTSSTSVRRSKRTIFSAARRR